jgi:threonyl-tRNA synthetase
MKPSIEIQIQDTSKSYPPGITPGEILRDNRVDNGCDVLAAALNGTAVDLSAPLTESGRLEFIAAPSPRGLEILRHSTAHVMAQAVKELFPDAKITLGPPVEEGFCYDFDTSRPFTPEDLDKIENRMSEIVRSRLPFRRMVLPKDEAIQLFLHKGETYKVELIKGFNVDDICLYSQGEFTDLCLGPHVPNSGFIRAFKLIKVTGTYWRGDERNPMLQRICGTAFPSEQSLKFRLKLQEEAKQTDRRRLGGAKEITGRTVAVRDRGDDATGALSLEEFMSRTREEVDRRA